MALDRLRITVWNLTLAGLAAALVGLPPRATALEIWTAPTTQKIFRDDRPAPGAPADVRLEAAGGETEAVQVVLRADRQGCLLTGATLGEFHDAAGAACPEIRAEVLQVAYVYLPERNRAWPDALPPLRAPLPLLPDLAQPLWLRVRVGPTTPAGTYRATLSLAFEGEPPRDVPVTLRVYGFRLPEQPSLRTAIGNQMEFVFRQHGVPPGTPEAADLERTYYRFFLERRLSPYNLPCDLFSPEAATWLEDPRLTSFVIPWNDDEAHLRRVVEHLARHDWLRKGFFYIWDEPQTQDDFDALAVRARLIRGIEPRAAIMVPFNGNPREATGRSTYGRLDGLVDQWCPLSSAVEVDEQARRAAAGAGSWWYVCCVPRQPRANLMVDWPGAAHRALFWQQKQRGIDGFLYWSATYWDPQFTRDPWTNIRTYVFKGDSYGDGSLVYPGDRVGIAGPVTSIRLELLCDGMDDFEYLSLFEKRRGRDAMLALTRRVTTSLGEYATDPAVYDAVRREIAEALEQDAAAGPPAFPGAEGWGRFAAGGRGGDVYAVTSLDDDGPGTLRDALRAGNRTVIFRVSGTIVLESELFLEQSHVTIAGQTAPGDGICLRRFPLRIRGAKDIIVRHLRIRVGDEAGRPLDGLEVRNSENVIIDHCSLSWTTDEALNTWHGTRCLTVQWCLISEPLHRSVHRRAHGFAASVGGQDTSYHHNLFAHAAGRNPSIAGGDHDHTIRMDWRNNVIFNWRQRTCDGKPMSVNVVNNYYKPGPATQPGVARCIAKIDDNLAKYANFEPRWHIEGNVVAGAPELTADNWRGGVLFDGGTSEAKNRERAAFPFAPVATQPAAEVYELVLADVGATRPARDPVDLRVLGEVADGTATCGDHGIIDRPSEAGGWPNLASTPPPPDGDGDGMPDAWEAGRGLNPHDPEDRNGHEIDADSTNIEVYLNELAGDRGSQP